jgi:hypothetical protein
MVSSSSTSLCDIKSFMSAIRTLLTFVGAPPLWHTSGLNSRPEKFKLRHSLLFGRLDNEPVVGTGLHVGDELAVSCDKVVDHMRAKDFEKQ